MSEYNIEEIYRSLELPVGTRFHFRNVPYEVAELEDEAWGCSQCAFAGEEDLCGVMNCHNCRHDKKFIFFNEVRETEEER